MGVLLGAPSESNKHAFGIPDIAIIITTACWGLNFVITKSAAGNDPEQFRIFIYNIIRFSLASVLLFLTVKVQGRSPLIDRHQIKVVAGLSFIGIFLYQVLYMIGQTLTSASNIGIIYSFMPLMILLVSVAARIERPTVPTIAGVLLGCFGLVMILFKGGKLTLDFGSFLFLCACLCFASYAVFGKPVLEKIPPVTLMAWILLFGTLYQLPLAVWQFTEQSWADITGQNILFVFLAALLSQYVGYTLFYYAISRLGPSKSGVYTNLTPVFTLLFAVMIRGETIQSIQIAGLMVIITGIGVTKLRLPKKTQNNR